MTLSDTTARSQTDTASFAIDLAHPPGRVWRALTEPDLLAEWLLPVIDLRLAPGAEFTFETQPHPGWDGSVRCRFVEIERHRTLSYTWTVGEMALDTLVTFSETWRRSPGFCGLMLTARKWASPNRTG